MMSDEQLQPESDCGFEKVAEAVAAYIAAADRASGRDEEAGDGPVTSDA
jgi:hypothetical protein